MTQFSAATATPEAAILQGMTIAVHAHRNPNGAAIISPNGDRTWSGLNFRINQIARMFRNHGLKAGDAVALLAHNAPEFVEVWAACQRTGMRITAVNWHQSPEIIAYVVDNCDAKALIASARFKGAALEAVRLAKQLTLKIAFAGSIEGFENYEQLVNQESCEDIPDPEVGSTMLYTSGTTGRPKGVFRATRPVVSQLTNVANETAKWQAGKDVSLLTGPLYHAAPLGLNLVLPIKGSLVVVPARSSEPKLKVFGVKAVFSRIR